MMVSINIEVGSRRRKLFRCGCGRRVRLFGRVSSNNELVPLRIHREEKRFIKRLEEICCGENVLEFTMKRMSE